MALTAAPIRDLGSFHAMWKHGRAVLLTVPFLKTSIPEETMLLFERVMTRKRYQNSDEVKMADFTAREKFLIEKGGGITNLRKRFKSL